MRIPIVKDGWPWIIVPLAAGLGGWWGLHSAGHAAAGAVVGAGLFVVSAFMVYFHRDPFREIPEGATLILAGADGLIRRVEQISEPRFMGGDTVRISIFLSPFNVHVNRAPVAGEVTKLDYTPGRHVLTIRNEASEVNEHSSILIEGSETRCLVRQIVGPLVRRVVHWLDVGQAVSRGESIGMMRFGSRLDIYLPANEVDVVVKEGDRVRAGLTVVARVRSRG